MGYLKELNDNQRRAKTMKKKELLEKIRKDIDAPESTSVKNMRRECYKMVKEQVSIFAPYIKEYFISRERYENSPSLKNGSMMGDAKVKAIEIVKKVDEQVDYEYQKKYCEFVSQAQLDDFIIDAIHENGLNVFKVKEILDECV